MEGIEKMNVKDEIKTNYLSFLSEIQDDFDQTIKLMREQHNEKWFWGKAVLGPLVLLGKQSKYFKTLTAVKWGSIVAAIGGIVPGSLTLANLTPDIPAWGWILAFSGSLIVGYTVVVNWYIGKMATIGTPYFHVGAFKLKRAAEYQIWHKFISKTDFNFKSLYDFVNLVFNHSSDDSILLSLTEGRITEKQAEIIKLEEAIIGYEAVIASLQEDMRELENSIAHLVGMLKKVNENLYRLNNGRLSLTDLDFVPGYSIYRIQGDQLQFIQDKGTSGNSPEIIDMKDPKNRELAVVLAAQSTKQAVYEDEPYPGRILIAFRMNMLEDEKWVWCFHLDSDDERSLSLVQRNDIISATVTYRMIHAFCLLLHAIMLSDKEEHQHDSI